jgi:hypothetical protein
VCNLVILSGLVVSVLDIGPKVHRFNLGQGLWIIKGDKNPQQAFLRRGSKAVGPCHKMLWHVLEPFDV